MKNTFENIDDYILLFPEEVQEKLQEIRKVIHTQNPEIEEYIGYQMPAFKYKKKPLVSWVTWLSLRLPWPPLDCLASWYTP